MLDVPRTSTDLTPTSLARLFCPAEAPRFLLHMTRYVSSSGVTIVSAYLSLLQIYGPGGQDVFTDGDGPILVYRASPHLSIN